MLVAHVAREVFILHDVDGHIGDHIEGFRRLLHHGGIILVLCLGFTLDAGFHRVGDDDPIPHLVAQSADALGDGAELIHGSFPFLYPNFS